MIVLTGVSGFIGGHLYTYLDDLGYDVESFDMRTDSLLEIGEDISVLIHCAWPKLPLQDSAHSEFIVDSMKLFDECKNKGIRVINIGSSSEYGVKIEPMKESMRCEPITAYGIAKLAVTLYAKKLGFNTLRLFTVTGDGGKSFFDVKDSSGKWGCPSDVRDIVPIEIVTKAVERLIHAPHLYGEIINVGTGNGIRYGEMSTGKDKGKWLKYPQRQYEPRYWEADTTKMKRLLNL